MPEKSKTLLYTTSIILLFVLLLVIIWLVYNYEVHKLDNQEKHITAWLQWLPEKCLYYLKNIY